MKSQQIALTVDMVIFSKNKTHLDVLLIKRKNEPFKNQWAFPGGFVEKEENLLDAAKRELKEETGIEISNLYQSATFGEVNRDPRGRTVTVVYYSVLNEKIKVKANDDAKDAKWFNMNDLPILAFDHLEILEFVKSQL